MKDTSSDRPTQPAPQEGPRFALPRRVVPQGPILRVDVPLPGPSTEDTASLFLEVVLLLERAWAAERQALAPAGDLVVLVNRRGASALGLYMAQTALGAALEWLQCWAPGRTVVWAGYVHPEGELAVQLQVLVSAPLGPRGLG